MFSYRSSKPIDDHSACEHDHAHTHEPAHSHEHDHGEHQTPLPQSCTGEDKCCAGISVSNNITSLPGALEIPTGSIKTQLRIAQMDCPTEEALIRKKLGEMTEVSSLDFNLMQRLLTVVHLIDALPAI